MCPKFFKTDRNGRSFFFFFFKLKAHQIGTTQLFPFKGHSDRFVKGVLFQYSFPEFPWPFPPDIPSNYNFNPYPLQVIGGANISTYEEFYDSDGLIVGEGY